eukprot:Rmarinus@m.23480
MQFTDSSTGGALTCVSCALKFPTHEEQKMHFKTDLHRVNLKRRVAGLPCLSEDELKVRMEEAFEANKAPPSRKGKKGGKQYSCDICSKTFHSESSLENHNRSSKHQITKALADGQSIEDIQAAERAATELAMQKRIKMAKPLENEECIFCPHVKCSSIADNLQHMAKKHGFFIPFIEHVTDLPALLNYIMHKVSVGYTCLACERSFQSLSATRAHMVDKHHTQWSAFDRAVEEEEEEADDDYLDFYDFGSDAESDDETDDDEGGWEEVSDDDADGLAEDGSETSDEHKQRRKRRQPKLAGDGLSLEVTSAATGKHRTLGNKEFRRYYKQRPRPESSGEAAGAALLALETSGTLMAYRNLGAITAYSQMDPKMKAATKVARRAERRRRAADGKLGSTKLSLVNRGGGAKGRTGGERC